MKRLFFFLAFFAGLAVALAVVRSEVSSGAAARQIAAVLVPDGDRPAAVSGEATVRLFPRLAVVFKGVRIAASHDATLARPDLTADSIVADIDLLPLLIGETSVSQVVLVRPQMRVETTFDLAGFVPDRSALSRMQPASVIVHNGTIRFVSPDQAREETLGDIEANLHWPRALGNLSLDGTADWHGERIGLSLQGIAPPRLGVGEPGDIDMTLTGPSYHMSFAGQALLSDRLQLDGIFSAGADDPQRLSGPLSAGDPPSRQISLPPVDVGGHLRSQGWLVALSDAHVTIGDARADGVLSARIDLDRPQVRGTLAIGDIDLTPALGAITTQGWRSWTPASTALSSLDVDLRLSIGGALIGATRMTDIAASLLIADGEIHGEIGDVTVYGGIGSFLLHGALTDTGLTATGRYTLKDASANALKSAFSLTDLPRLGGTMSLSGDFATNGRSLDAAIGHLRGHADCRAPQVVADGLASATVAFMAAPSPILQQASLKLGLNPELDQLTCGLSFEGSDLAFQHIDFQMARLTFNLGGTASVTRRTIALTGNARPMAPAASTASPTDEAAGTTAPPAPMQVPVRLSGALDHPVVTFGADIPIDPDAATGTIAPPSTPN